MVSRAAGDRSDSATEAKLSQVQAGNKSIDDSDQCVRGNIVINTRRKQADLISRESLNKTHSHPGAEDGKIIGFYTDRFMSKSLLLALNICARWRNNSLQMLRASEKDQVRSAGFSVTSKQWPLARRAATRSFWNPVRDRRW